MTMSTREAMAAPIVQKIYQDVFGEDGHAMGKVFDVEDERFLYFFSTKVTKPVEQLSHVQPGHGFLSVFAYEIASKLQRFLVQHVYEDDCQRVLSLLIAREFEDWSVKLGTEQILVDSMKDAIEKRDNLIHLCTKTPQLHDLTYWLGPNGIVKVLGEVSSILREILQEWPVYKAQESLNKGISEVHRMIQSGFILSSNEAYIRMRPDEIAAPPLIEIARDGETFKPECNVDKIFHAFVTDGIVVNALLKKDGVDEASAPFPRVDTEAGRLQMQERLNLPLSLVDDLCLFVDDYFPRSDAVGWTREKQVELISVWLEILSGLTSLAGAVGLMRLVQEISDIGGDLLLAEGAEQKDVCQIMQACKGWLEDTLAKTAKLRDLQDDYNRTMLETTRRGWIWQTSRFVDLKYADMMNKTSTEEFKNALAKIDELQSKVQSLERKELVKKRRNACSNLRKTRRRLFRRFAGLGNFIAEQADKEDEEESCKMAGARRKKKEQKTVRLEEKQDEEQPRRYAGKEEPREKQEVKVVRLEDTQEEKVVEPGEKQGEEQSCGCAGAEEVREKQDEKVLQQSPKLISIQGKSSRIDGFYSQSDVIYNGHPTWEKFVDPVMMIYSNDEGGWAVTEPHEVTLNTAYMITNVHNGQAPTELEWHERVNGKSVHLHAVSCTETTAATEVERNYSLLSERNLSLVSSCDAPTTMRSCPDDSWRDFFQAHQDYANIAALREMEASSVELIRKIAPEAIRRSDKIFGCAEKCFRCGEKKGYFFSRKGFGWRERTHDARCKNRMCERR